MSLQLEMSGIALRGRRENALKAISLRVEEGSLYALAGNRGSGNSQLLQIAAGLLRPDSGKVRVCGLDLADRSARKRLPSKIGYMAAISGQDPELTVLESMEFFSHAYGITGLSGREAALRLLRETGMERLTDERCGTLPLSVRRKLDLVRTMLHRPKLLLLDRPFAGMDRREAASSRTILRQAAAEGMTVVFTADTMAECMNLCTEMTVLAGGRRIGAGTAGEIAARFRERSPIYMEVADGEEIVRQILSQEGREQSNKDFVGRLWVSKGACYARTEHFQEALECLQQAFVMTRDNTLPEKMYLLNVMMGRDELQLIQEDAPLSMSNP